MIPALLLFLVTGFAIGLVLTAVLVRLGRRLGAMDSAGAEGHVKELRHVPNIGGVAIVAALVLPMVAGLAGFHAMGADWWIQRLPDTVAAASDPAFLAERIAGTTPAALAMLGCIVALHVMGVVDDRRALPAIPKLLLQIGAAAVMAVFFDVRLLTLLGTPLSIAVTIIWIVAMTNAINFLDNMDGLAGGIAFVASCILAAAAAMADQWFVAGVLLLLAGGLAGFLVFNAPPAKVFMGDGGSLVVGFVLAVMTARITFVHPGLGGAKHAVFLPLAVLAIPIYDFTTVTVIRILQGKSPLVGDQQHFSHRLVKRGLSRRGAVAVIVSLSAVTGISGLSLGWLQPWLAWLAGVQTLLVLGVIGMLEFAARRSGPGGGR